MGRPKGTSYVCGHEPHYSKGKCEKCYYADWRAERRTPAAIERRAAGELRAQDRAAYDREYQRQRYLRDKDKMRARNRAWREKNQIALAALKELRQGRVASNGRCDLTPCQWAHVLAEFDYRCAYCNVRGGQLTIDHMLPLSRAGEHTAENVVPACRSCNSRKHTKTALEFAGGSRLGIKGK